MAFTHEGGDSPAAPSPIASADISAVLLAGGQGSRMGGVDKGLQPFRGRTLGQQALQRLRAQSLPPAQVMVSANRHLAAYAAWGLPVWPDELPAGVPGPAGPLAGVLTALAHCGTPWLLTLPCDVPFFPLSICERLAQAACGHDVDLALAATITARVAAGAAPALRSQPVFSLMHVRLRADLARYLAQGGRKVQDWVARQRHVQVTFAAPHEAAAFANANTLAQLQALERRPDRDTETEQSLR